MAPHLFLMNPSVMSVTLLVLTMLLIAAFKFWQKPYRLPPGSQGLPFFGNYFALAHSKLQPRDIFNQWTKKYGDIFTYRIFGTRFVVVSDPDLVKECFVSADINDKAPILPCNKALGRPNSSLGIIGSNDNPKWRLQRKLVLKVLRNIKHLGLDIEELVTSQTKALVDTFQNYDGAFNPKTDIYVAVSNVTNSILLGKTFERHDKEFLHFTDLVQEVFEYLAAGTFNYHVMFMTHLPLKANRRANDAIKKMFSFIAEIVDGERKSFNPNDKPRNMIQYMLRERNEHTNKDGNTSIFDAMSLLQITWDLIIGGYDSISTNLVWYFLLMTRYPHVQARVQQELNAIVGRGNLPTLADQSRLPYTAAAMVECYRFIGLNEHIWHRSRRDCRVGGYDIPRGTFVAANLVWIAQSQDMWKDATEFLPDRFLDEEGAFRHKLEGNLCEFGRGRRICPGEELARNELFLFFTHVLHRCSLRAPEGVSVPLKGISGLSYHAPDFTMHVTPR